MPFDAEILGHGVYTPREAARLIGESSQQVLRWTRGSGPSEPLWHAYYQFLEDSTELSFLDLVELRVVAAMRRAGISLQSIRYAIEFSQNKMGIERPLASRRFQVDGTELLMDAVENDGNFVSLSKKRPGQKVFAEIIKSSLSDIEYENDTAARWRPDGFKDIIIDPKRSFGEPITDIFGISTLTIASEYSEFQDAQYLSKIYEVPVGLIRQCINYEAQLDALSERKSAQGSL